MFSPRKFFTRKSSSSSLRDVRSPTFPAEEPPRKQFSSLESNHSRRDMSPESLRRFLVDDHPIEEELDAEDRPSIAIPEDIAEEMEDDDNLRPRQRSETAPFTVLSPPPSGRSFSPAPASTASDVATERPETPSLPSQIPSAPAGRLHASP